MATDTVTLQAVVAATAEGWLESPDQIRSALKEQLERSCERDGYTMVDEVRIAPEPLYVRARVEVVREGSDGGD